VTRTSHPHIRINPRIFTALVIVALPLLAVGGFVVVGIGQGQFRDTSGAHLEQIAERTAAAVDTFVLRRIIDVSLLARVPEVRASAAARGRTPFDANLAREIDQQWQRQQTPPEQVAGLLDNPASRFFRDVVQNDAIYGELLLTDVDGRLAAASGVTSDYLQSDEQWWRDAFTRRSPQISDVNWDESAKIYAIEISVPVYAPGSDEVTGVLKAVTNSSEMLAILSGVRFGETGEAVLVRKDGSLVYGRRAVRPDDRFFAAALLRESLGLSGAVAPEPAAQTDRATDPHFRAHFSAQLPDGGKATVAVAPTQLGISYPNLPWLVAVSQAESELFAPARAQMWSFAMLLALVSMAVLVLALWFSMRLAASPLDTGMALVQHARVHRVDENEEDQDEEGKEEGETLQQSV